ncbi:MAG: AbgT family transporter [Phycisphaeraceae bacterium]|nr:MAG: AbgT family transporter [Phycisphaeraceae bacterium]
MAIPPPARPPGILGLIEWLGNKLPDPVFLFISATLLVAVVSAVGSAASWRVQPVKPQVVTETVTGPDGREVTRPVTRPDGRPVTVLVDSGDPIGPNSLISSDGVYWLFANAVRNFINFPPLGVVLVGMFGIGIAERVGLFAAAMRWLATLIPSRLLTPSIVFLGITSNIASDAGYIILPPLAAALYVAFGRPPLAGIAAAFAGVSAGFSANLMIGSTDTLIAGITQVGARVLDPAYTILPTCNWWFLAVSTFVLTLAGWLVTAKIVEPRLARMPADPLPPDLSAAQGSLSPDERRGLRAAGVALVAALAGAAALLFVPGAPLYGDMPAPAPSLGTIPVKPSVPSTVFTPDPDQAAQGAAVLHKPFEIPARRVDPNGQETIGGFTPRVTPEPPTLPGSFRPAPPPGPRWSQAIVPLILVIFLIPGLAYGIVTGVIRSPRDITKAFVQTMQTMAPVITMAFFAAQFIECFKYSRLDAMLANVGGSALVAAGLGPTPLLLAVVLLTMGVNILMSSMSAKWTALAPIIVPMMMMVGISPEMTQAAYRVGDSVTNIVTPLNTYVIIILVAMQRYRKDAGIGNLIALMLPYSVVFFIFWSLLLVAWVFFAFAPGPAAPLWYAPGHH